jgi:DNA-binding LacI/PurR family transcriptional regulator
MAKLVVHSAAEQVAAYLRGELLAGAWSGLMPGGDRLAAELGVGSDTIEAALKQLEHEGFLVNQGRRRGRLIARPAGAGATRRLRVALLLFEAGDRRTETILDLEHELKEAGHLVLFARKYLTDLGMDLGRVARMVEATEAEAWVVVGGGREVLEWFAAREQPAFALFGRRRGVRIAGTGPDKLPVFAAIARALIGLGHRRIVLLARWMRRLPVPGAPEQAFLNELAAHGIAPGPYHLPDWEESIDGYHARLESMFQLHPPTALIVDEAPLFVAAQQFLARGNLHVPEDVSLVCTDNDPSFEWCRPMVSHIRWEPRPVVNRIVRWAANVSRGKKDRRQSLTPAEFVEGGTVGRVSRGRA